MPTVSLKPNPSLQEYQEIVAKIYGPNNLRHFTIDEMLTNISRFTMRALKGIRKQDRDKVIVNVMVAMSWFTSLLNQLGIDLEEQVWKRFPYLCSYCGKCPCLCKTRKIKKRIPALVDRRKKPTSIRGYQEMFEAIYPSSSRTLEHAGIHLAEEVGELSEALLKFRGHHRDADFSAVELEVSDLFSCFMGVVNSLKFDYQAELVRKFKNGCHVCTSAPCRCQYDFVVNFKS